MTKRVLIAEDETIIRLDLRALIRGGRLPDLRRGPRREETATLAEALAARKLIERAKGLLMAKENLTEEDAFVRPPPREPGLGPADARPRRGADRTIGH